jgi:gliding motility-associated-like protein
MTSRTLLVLCAITFSLAAMAGHTKYWVGGSGEWSDAQHWSLTAGGPGGAGIPRADEAATILPMQAITVTIDRNATCAGLMLDGSSAMIVLNGNSRAEIRVNGDLRAHGQVQWAFDGALMLAHGAGEVVLDTRGVAINSDVLIDGRGPWTMQTDLTVTDAHTLTMRQGTLVTNGNTLRAGVLRFEGRQEKLMIVDGSAVLLASAFEPGTIDGVVEQGRSHLFVGDEERGWGRAARDLPEEERGISVCGTGPGQTPFTINAQVLTDFNGYNVTCNGICDAEVTVTVTGGVGPSFTYLWSGGGPTTQTWLNTCAGNKLVIVTDQGQGIGCAATVQVLGPPPLGVIFFPPLTPPSCASACDGSGTALPVGGTGSGYTFNWNNGAGTNATFNQLCAEANTLQIQDSNLCSFDTVFTLGPDPISAVLTISAPACNSSCDGAASVVVTGGTGQITYNWEPGAPIGDGSSSVSQLCAGNYSLLLSDANGCDTTLIFTITEPPPIVPNATIVPATCPDVCDGQVSFAPSGATGPYQYLWIPGGQTTSSRTGLCAGAYQCRITDQASGCDTLVSVLVGAPPPIIPVPTSTNVTCNGDCDGTAGAVVSGGSGVYTYFWVPTPPVGQFTANASQLCPGTYDLTITDNTGCDTTVQFIITQPPPILPNEVITPITCAGACNGIITCGPTGGTGNYSYVWTPSPPNGDGTASASGLCAGTWIVTITDDAGCDTVLTILLTEPPPIVITPTQTNVSCGTLCDGSATALVSGGTAPYAYQWSPPPGGPQGNSTANGLCAGPYTLTVTDSLDCTQEQVYTILPPPPIIVTLQTQNATCPDFCNGSALAVGTGGYGPLSFQWDPAPGGGQNTPNATGLCAQDYTLTVSDTTGCDTVINFTIGAPLPIEANATVTNATCFGECNGSIVLAITGGAGSYTYAWTPTPSNGPDQAQALLLCAGTWQVLVSDGTCDTTLVFDITEPTPLNAGLTTTPVSCFGACDGTATSAASGGSPGYTYVWSPAPGDGQGTPAATQMCAGHYTLTITDDAGCDTTIAFTIDAPEELVPTVTTTLASCGGACDGTATVSFTGGAGTVSIIWSPDPGSGQFTATAGDMCPGIWSMTLTDSAGCDTTVQFIINTPSGIQAVPTATNASCFDVCDGTIVLDVSGGVPSYDYSWIPPPPAGSGPSISGLCPGTWTVQIGDMAGCDTTLVIDITAPSPIVPNGSFTNETCNGPCDGTAAVNPTGGAGGYTYFWDPVPTGQQGQASVSGLCAGDWSVTITDASGCDTVWAFTVLPEQPIEPGLSSTNATCAFLCNGSASVAPIGGVPGYTFEWQPEPPVGQGSTAISGLCLGLWSVRITDAADCDTTVSFFITKPSPITISLGVQGADCNDSCSGEAAAFPSGGNGGFTFFWQPPPGSGQGTFFVDGLCAGTAYLVTVTDSLGCDTTEAFTVPAFIPLQALATVVPESCSGACDATVSLSVTGGQGPYTYDWSPDPINGDGTAEVTDLCAGSYDVLILDVNGCDTTITVEVTGPEPIVLLPIVQNIRCNGECNGSIIINSFGGVGPFTYLWNPQPPVGQGTASVSQLCAGPWTVQITDSTGCTASYSTTLVDPPPFSVGVSVVESACQICQGAISLDPDGAGPFTFLWGPPIGQVGQDSVQTGLCAGLYPVTAIDAFGCAVQLDIPVSDSNAEVLTTTDGTVTCPTDCDGSVSVNYVCGTPACTVAWYDPQGFPLFLSTDTISGLCAGVYLAQVTNGDGCIRFDTAQVIAPEPMVLQIGSTPVSCADRCDGTAGFGIVGGVPPYTVQWTPEPATGQGTPNVTGLCAGTYDITLTDANGCVVQSGVLILGPQPLDASATVQGISCPGACDGVIDLNTQGGTGAYQYTWSPIPPNGQGGSIASSLCPGTWTVNVADANGCDSTFSFTLVDPQPLSLVPTVTPSQCLVCNGTVSVQVSGGTGLVTVNWTDASGNVVGSGNVLTGLCAGIYTATAQDVNGCGTSVIAVVSDATGEDLVITNGQTSCANNCDGAVSVAFNCTSGPCEIAWYNAQAQLLASNQFTLADLCVGTYFVQVTNGDGCNVIDTAFVVPSQLLVPNLSTIPVSCSGACDGVATVGPTGGIAPYTYDWTPDPPGGDSSATATGLCAGVWSVSIRDSLGCDTTISALILSPDPLQVSGQVTDVSCNAACDGAISLLAVGGNGQFTYLWDPAPSVGQGTADVSGLCAGTWSVLVSAPAGCDTTITFTVSEPQPLALATSSTQSTCGVCSGSATVVVSGGTPPFAYAWTLNGQLLGTDSLLTAVCAGFYQVTVTDGRGCSTVALVPVSDVDGEVVNATADIVTCPGSCDGAVQAVFTCSEPSCSVAWYDGVGNDLGVATSTIDSLCPGTYLVVVTNGLGCVAIDTSLVTEPQPLVPNLTTTPATCAGACDGTATVSPTGGVAPFSYEWSPDPVTGDSTTSVTGLCAGTYTVLISDSVGCSILQDVLILEPQPLSADAQITPVTCNGVCDADIVLDPQGGTGPYTFLWTPVPSNGQGDSLALQLCAGPITVSITDANGCDTTYTFTVTDPPPLDVTVGVTDNVCFGDCNGVAIATITGGVPGYTVSWLDAMGQVIFVGDTVLSGLCAGDYAVAVVDTNGCEVQRPFVVGQGAEITSGLVFQGETCLGPCDGTAGITPGGGAGGVGIVWNDANGNAFATDVTTVTGLCAGNYSVTITDSLGCAVAFPFTILPYTDISDNAAVNQVLCNGACDGNITLAATGGIGQLSYDWEPPPPNGDGTNAATNLCPGSWVVTVTDAVGCDSTFSYLITEPDPITITVDQVVDASCSTAPDGSIAATITGGTPNLDVQWSGPNGFTSSAEDITGLLTGDYSVTVTDANSCTQQLSVSVAALVTVVADAGPDVQQCFGANVVLDGSTSTGAVNYLWTDDQGATIGTQPTLDLGVLAVGGHSYVLTVTDGPCSDTDTVQVSVLQLPLANAGPDQSIFLAGQVTLGGSPSGPTGSSFIWSPDSLVSQADAPNPTAQVSNTTLFILSVTTPEGCTSVDSVLITVVPEVFIPSGFTPNGDGSNDAWQIDHIDQFPDCTVEVYNRWGELLFTSTGYNVPWDGKYNDGLVPVGTYYYAIELNDERFPEPYTGPLTVIR